MLLLNSETRDFGRGFNWGKERFGGEMMTAD